MADAMRWLTTADEGEGEGLATMGRLMIPSLGDGFVLDLVEESGARRRVVTVHVDETKEAWLRQAMGPQVDGLPGDPFGVAARNGRMEVRLRVSDEDSARFFKGWAALGPPPFALGAYAVLPVVAGTRVLGVMAWTLDTADRGWSLLDLRAARALARQVGVALDRNRARRVAREQQDLAATATERAARLSAVSSILAGAVTYDEAFRAVLVEASRGLGATAGAIARVTADGTELEMLHVLGVSDEVRDAVAKLPLAAPLPMCDAVRLEVPVFLETKAIRETRYPQFRYLFEEIACGALAALPLLAGRRVVGAMCFAFDGSRTFPPADRAFAMDLAEHCAHAFHRTQVLDELTATIRAREQALEIASHDLRNPLYVMGLGIEALATARGHSPAEDQTLRAMLCAVNRMKALVADLLDLAKIEGQRLSLDLRRRDMAGLLCEAQDMMLLAARENGVELVVRGDPEGCAILCDCERFHQALGNLLANALRFTPRGGTIDVGCTLEGKEVHLTVQDTGRGIPPEDLSRVFERGWQGAGSTGGSGLGLAITRGILEAHGGRVAVTSVPGDGTTFHVWLPRVAPEGRAS